MRKWTRYADGLTHDSSDPDPPLRSSYSASGGLTGNASRFHWPIGELILLGIALQWAFTFLVWLMSDLV
jgi:hypothetical protein